MDQTVLSISQNVLEKLEKYKQEPCVFFTKVNQIFLKGQYGSTCIILDSSFTKDAWNRNKRRALDGNL